MMKLGEAAASLALSQWGRGTELLPCRLRSRKTSAAVCKSAVLWVSDTCCKQRTEIHQGEIPLYKLGH